MTDLVVEQFDELDEALIDEIGVALIPGDPQLEMFAEQMAEAQEITATPPVFFVARRAGAFAGYIRARKRSPSEDIWLFDMILGSPDGQNADIAFSLLDFIRRHVDMTKIEWWTRGASLPAAQAVATSFGLHMNRRILRMEMDTVGFATVEAIPTRGFRVEDAPFLVQLNNEAFRGHPDRAAIDVARLMNDLLVNGNRYEDIRILEYEDGIAGLVWVKEQFGRYGEIYLIALDAHHRGEGLGRHLLAAGVTYLAKNYASKRALLYVEATNEHAIDVYRACGFEDVNEPLVSFTKG